ncbi:MAG TPA: histidine kinase dimerization/phospho-acceptor domain-containing protein, partial [Nitrospirota bacterium]|nr:histidine kinase dimerization/phospho-acceptor domain-containing protein [Nitrospirota bacterium]
MRNKLTTRIVLYYLALVAVAAPCLWFFLSGAVEGYLTDRTAEGLKSQALIISDELETGEVGPGARELALKFKGITGARVTIIGADGRVLGDTDEDPSLMENHIYRPEVQAAMKDGWGRSTRYSRTLRIDMLYVAVPVIRDGRTSGFVRLSMPLHHVEAAMAGITRRLAAGAFVIFLAAVVLGVLLSRNITGKVGRMAAFARRVAQGDLSARLPADGGDELGVLASNLNEMAGQLRARMDSVFLEKATLEAVLGGMRECVLVTDKDGVVILANRSLREKFGVGREGSLGRPFIEVIRNAGLAGLVNDAHERREAVSGEVEVQFPEKLSFMAGCVPLVMKSGFAGVVLVLHDVTRLKALEAVRRDFVANVTHELRTPIAAIQGFSETLLAGALDEEENARRFLNIVESNARRLTTLIEDLLTLSTIETGDIALKLGPVPVRGACDEAVLLLGPKCGEKKLAVLVDIPGDVPDVLADKDRLHQVLLNVLDNAVKYTPEGGSIAISAKAPPPGGEMVRISIADTGVGIPPHLITRVGERFFRVDPARSREM